jgi:hypothetical protein
VGAVYSGDSTFATSTSSSATITVLAEGFTLAANNLEIQQGGSGASPITITPSNAYSGTIAFKVMPSANAPIDVCFSLPNVAVAGNGSVTAILSVSTSEGSCGTASVASVHHLPNPGGSQPGSWTRKTATALAGLILLGSLKRRSRSLRALLAMVILVGCGLAVTGCSGQNAASAGNPGNSNQNSIGTPGSSSQSDSGSDTGSSAPLTLKGSYNLTIIGTDTSSSTITSSTTLTLTIQ